MSEPRKTKASEEGDPGDLSKKLPSEYIARLHLNEKPETVAPTGAGPIPTKVVRKKNIRTHRKEAEASLRAGEAVFTGERLATEWFGSPNVSVAPRCSF
jgi:hypothetical protein